MGSPHAFKHSLRSRDALWNTVKSCCDNMSHQAIRFYTCTWAHAVKQKENKPITEILWDSVFRFKPFAQIIQFKSSFVMKLFLLLLKIRSTLTSGLWLLTYCTYHILCDRDGRKEKKKACISRSTISCWRDRIRDKLKTPLATNFDFLVDQEKWLHTSAHMRSHGYRMILYKYSQPITVDRLGKKTIS